MDRSAPSDLPGVVLPASENEFCGFLGAVFFAASDLLLLKLPVGSKAPLGSKVADGGPDLVESLFAGENPVLGGEKPDLDLLVASFNENVLEGGLFDPETVSVGLKPLEAGGFLNGFGSSFSGLRNVADLFPLSKTGFIGIVRF